MSKVTPLQLPPPLTQYEVELPLRDVFKHGDITGAAAWRHDKDHSQLTRQINASYPDESSLSVWYADLDAFYRTRFELGAAFFSLSSQLNTRFQVCAEPLPLHGLLHELSVIISELTARGGACAPLKQVELAQRGKDCLDRFMRGVGLREAYEEPPAERAAGKGRL